MINKFTTYSFIILFVLMLKSFTSIYAQSACDCVSFTKEVRTSFETANRNGKYAETTVMIDNQKKSNEPCCQAIGFAMESIVLFMQAKSAESFASAKKAQALLNGRYNLFASIESNRILGMYYSKGINTDSAIYYYFKSLDMAKQANENYLVAKIYSNISLVYVNQKQYQKALEFQKKSLDYSLITKDTTVLAQAYANLVSMYGTMYDETNNKAYLDTSYQMASISLVFAKATKQPMNLIRIYLSLGKFSLAKNQYEQAMKYTDSILLLVNEKTHPSIFNSVYIDRGAAFLGLKKYPAAIESLNKAFDYAKKVNNPFMEKMMYGKLYEAYKAKGETQLALQTLEKYKEMSDSLVTKQNAEAISEMESKYNKVADGRTIKELAQQKRFYVLLAAAGLLGFIALVFYIRQQSFKNKKNILETEQRLNRARMNPHFFFNALSSLQSFALQENDGKALASNLSKFSHIMRETLESSYKDYVTIEQEIDFLNEYLELQKMRFPEKFTYEINTSADLEPHELLIPSMIIQPFAENSVEHGFYGIDYPGHIKILFSKTEKEIKIDVIDNGIGFGGTPKKVDGHISRASQIIKDRIYLLNMKLKTKARFSIEDHPSGKGIYVQIFLPLNLQNESTDS